MTTTEAAKALGVSTSTAENYDAGAYRGAAKGKKARPPFAVRVLMWLIAKRQQVKPWPAE